MKFISWNVNGLRAVVTKGFEKFFKDIDADYLCIQETKMHENPIDLRIETIFKPAIKNGFLEIKVIEIDDDECDMLEKNIIK